MIRRLLLALAALWPAAAFGAGCPSAGPLLAQNLLGEIACRGPSAQAQALAALGGLSGVVPNAPFLTGVGNVLTAGALDGSLSGGGAVPLAVVYGTTVDTALQGNLLGAANGVASLDGNSLVPIAQIPNIPATQITGSFSSLSITPGTLQVAGQTITLPGATSALLFTTSPLISGQCLQASGTAGAVTVSGAPCGSGGGGGGSVSTVSVVPGNGFSGSVSNPTTSPAISLSTTVTGLLKGNGAAISAATAGTDYLTPTGSGAQLTGITAPAGALTGTTLASNVVTSSLVSAAGGTFGTAAFVDTGISGATVPLNNSNNTESGAWIFNGGLTGTLTGGASLDLPLGGGTLTGPLVGADGGIWSSAGISGLTALSAGTSVLGVGSTYNLTVTGGTTGVTLGVNATGGTGGMTFNTRNAQPAVFNNGVEASRFFTPGNSYTLSGSTIPPTLATFSANPTGTSTLAGDTSLNLINFGSASDNASADDINTVVVGGNYGGTNFDGSRVGLTANMNLNTASPNSLGAGLVGLGSLVTVNVNVGGISSGYGATQSGIGSIFGANPWARCETGFTYGRQCVGTEIDAALETGANVIRFTLQQDVLTSTHQTHGTIIDTMFAMAAQVSAVGLTPTGVYNLITAGDYGSQWPVDPNGGLFRVTTGENYGRMPTAAAYGSDLNQLAVTGTATEGAGFYWRNPGLQLLSSGAQIGYLGISTGASGPVIDATYYEQTAVASSLTVSGGGASGGTNFTNGDIACTASGGLCVVVQDPVISSLSYNSGTGAVSITTNINHGLSSSSSFNLSSLAGTGQFAQLSGVQTATAGTTGTTLNFTGPTGLTLTVSSGAIGGVPALGISSIYTQGWTANPPSNPISFTQVIHTGLTYGSGLIVGGFTWARANSGSPVVTLGGTATINLAGSVQAGGTAGVTCASVTAATMTVKNGIVTHC